MTTPQNQNQHPAGSSSEQSQEEEASSPIVMVVEDPENILTRRPSLPAFRQSRATASRSLSSAHDDDSISVQNDNDEQAQQQQQAERRHSSFPELRRVGTFPQTGNSNSNLNLNACTDHSCGPPRRPSRSTSLERSQHQHQLQQEVADLEHHHHHHHCASDKDDNDGAASSCCSSGYQDLHNESSDDEIDRDKFRQLLMGNRCDTCGTGSSSFRAMRADGHAAAEDMMGDHDDNDDLLYEDSCCVTPTSLAARTSGGNGKLRPRKSWGSAPPKFPSRMDSDTENLKVAAAAAAMPTTFGTRQQSLPLSVFRASLQGRNRRRRSLIQDMLNPDSETSSKSVKMPPRLPSRTESDLSNASKASKNAIPAVLVLCNSALAATANTAASVSSSQRSTCEAPKRPRRSLSPIFGESLRTLIQQHQDEDDQDDGVASDKQTKEQCNSNSNKDELSFPAVDIITKKAKASPRTSTTTATTATTALSSQVALPSIPRRKRNLPVRAKTFSFSTKHHATGSFAAGAATSTTAPTSPVTTATATATLGPIMLSQQQQQAQANPNSCLALLSHNLAAGRDMAGVPISTFSGESLETLWTATTWPKPKRKRVAPGRSRTFNTNYQPTAIVVS